MTLLSRRGIAYGAGLSVLWAVLALLRPTVTYHLAPVIVAAAVPWTFVAEHRRQATQQDRLIMVAVGLAVAAATTTLLAVAGLLDGPSLLPIGGAALESYAGALVGGLLGLGSLLWERPSPP
ncbi:MAG: hypothetical protein ACE5MI_09385 [Acidimicrobiia bacterium]